MLVLSIHDCSPGWFSWMHRALHHLPSRTLHAQLCSLYAQALRQLRKDLQTADRDQKHLPCSQPAESAAARGSPHCKAMRNGRQFAGDVVMVRGGTCSSCGVTARELKRCHRSVTTQRRPSRLRQLRSSTRRSLPTMCTCLAPHPRQAGQDVRTLGSAAVQQGLTKPAWLIWRCCLPSRQDGSDL